MTQNNPGTELEALGERESGTSRLEEAVTAYRAALEERRPDNAPYFHEQTGLNLADAEALLAQRRARSGGS
ncbi:MAG TPA: hypothetical protein VMH86_02565 [Rhizomicrobium sp.]|nr:hypothetical protein [Rhizomicrobium sp.]